VLAVRPQDGVGYAPRRTSSSGNTVLYGATSGRAFFRGQAGERFAVRNSGASAVIEGVGDHGCEYMTGGAVVVLGPTGRNFAAGMSAAWPTCLDEAARCARASTRRWLDQLEELDEADAMELHALVAEHVERTGSAVGRRVLDGWADLLGSFVKIFPADFKRVLAEAAAATEEAAV
jgi:glutamate synthase (NADPH/NADH) large chain/glutamate synthase (ferredoxin)